ncbi:MAG: UDP-N-acetylmuramoyl-L-alanine--D-glutamate ligase [Phycisphaerae bacterium]
MLVVGLGRFGGGLGVTRWLCQQGAAVTVTDQAPAEALEDSLASLSDLDFAVRLGGHDVRDLDQADLVIVNPAVRKSMSEVFQAIERRGVPWSTELNLFCERCPAPIIGVTGTFGKSTVCTMLAEVLSDSESARGKWRNVCLGGNIGRSLLADLPDIRESDLVVCEMSNAQLEDLPRIHWAPPFAVITNLSPHHLDRHGGYDGYLSAKLNILRDPECQSRVFVGDVDRETADRICRSVTNHDERVTWIEPLDPEAKLRIPGEHNQANASCVMAVARYLGVEEAGARTVLAAFKGLPHRLEFVRTVGGVDYYNDSKSTSPQTTQRALRAFDRPVVAIVGGQSKPVSLDACAASLVESCRAVICTGEAGPAFDSAVRNACPAGSPDVCESPSLESAVQRASQLAEPGDVVLFSPGAPSFDAYNNYEERGLHYRRLVDAV